MPPPAHAAYGYHHQGGDGAPYPGYDHGIPAYNFDE
jgi:hypothetical protein